MLLTQEADGVCMDYIVYRKETCKIIEKEDGYYKLVPVNDTSIKYKVPVDSNFLKKVITKYFNCNEYDKALEYRNSYC